MTNVRCFNKERQNGAALIIIVFILAIALTSYILKEMNVQSIQVERQQLVLERLNEAKQSLLSWSVANSHHPGQMPYPDRNTGGGYDGNSDCISFIADESNLHLLIGHLPVSGHTWPCTQPHNGLGLDANDDLNKRFWYAVSPNLVHNFYFTDPIINSDITHNPDPLNPQDLHKPWLKVLDYNGNIISDRVAAVIIAPGEAIGNQSRSNTATKENYLDSFQKNGNTYSNIDYDENDEDFIMGTPMGVISEADSSYTRPYLFNDQLVYITIDELMIAIEKRAATEAVSRLRVFFNLNGYLPYASIDFATNQCQVGVHEGLLPFQSCSGVDALPAVADDWFINNRWDDLLFYAVSSDCVPSSASTPKCSNATLTVGTQSAVSALIISSGHELAQTQVSPTISQIGQRPFLDLRYYLDSNENVSVANETYDAVGTPITSTYNDQMFIVAP